MQQLWFDFVWEQQPVKPKRRRPAGEIDKEIIDCLEILQDRPQFGNPEHVYAARLLESTRLPFTLEHFKRKEPKS